MNNTTWSNKIKESFVVASHSGQEEEDSQRYEEGFNPFPVPETDSELINPQSADENILLSKLKSDTAKEPPKPAYPEKSLTDQLNSLRENPNLMKVTSLYKNGIQFAKAFASGQSEAIMDSILGFYYKDPKAPEAKRSSTILSRQISLYLAIPMTYWMVLNWWHTWNYTEGTAEFNEVLEWKMFKIIQFGIEPPIRMLDIFDYYLLGQRLDKNLNPKRRAFFRSAWDWRPVTFTVFYIIMLGGILNTPIFSFITDVLEGNPSIFSSLISIGSIFLFFSYNFTFERFLKYLKIVGLQLFVPIIMLFVFVLVIIFSFVAAVILAFYLFFYSHFAIFYHNGFNPFAIIKKIKQMFEDLQDAPVTISEPEEKDYYTKIQNFGFRNFHNLFLLFAILLPLLIKNCSEAAVNVKSTGLLSVIVIINLLLVGLLGLAPMWGTVRYFLNLVTKFAFSSKPVSKEQNLQPIPTGGEGPSQSNKEMPEPATTSDEEASAPTLEEIETGEAMSAPSAPTLEQIETGEAMANAENNETVTDTASTAENATESNTDAAATSDNAQQPTPGVANAEKEETKETKEAQPPSSGMTEPPTTGVVNSSPSKPSP